LSIYLSDELKEKFSELFLKGLSRLKQKDPLPGDRISFAFIPKYFIGIALGVLSLDVKERNEYVKWLKGILKKREESEQISKNILYVLLKAILDGGRHTINLHNVNNLNLEALSVLEWGIRNNYFQFQDTDMLLNIKRRILTIFLETELEVLQPTFSSFILSSVHSCILESVNSIVLTSNHISKILGNFESALRRFKWKINEEKDVQDIVWLILRCYFYDLVDEEHLPKFGHKSSKPDFGIPSLKLLIEVKFVRNQRDFKKIEDEIKADYIDYLNHPNYNKLLIFVYDDSSSVQEHSITIEALKNLDGGIEDVIIVSKPSHIGDSR
jgi:hypothetical protein